jgi:hypothetical protein
MNTNPFSSEASDPFHVPDRTSEIFLLLVGTLFATFLPLGLALVPLKPVNLMVILSSGLVAVVILMNGMAARRHRLRRAQEVNELRNRLFRD